MKITARLFEFFTFSLLVFVTTAVNAVDTHPTEYAIATITPMWVDSARETNGLRDKLPNEDLRKLWNSLSGQASASIDHAPPKKILTPDNLDEINVVINWLRWMVLSQKADSRYAYAYAMYLHQVQNPDGTRPLLKEAGIFLMYGRLALEIDGAWCADRGSLPVVWKNIESAKLYRSMIETISKLDKVLQARLLLQALAIENAVKRDKPWTTVCKSGPIGLMNAIESNAPQVVTTGKDKTTDVAVDVSNVQPVLVEESIWKTRRRTVLDRQLINVATNMK